MVDVGMGEENGFNFLCGNGDGHIFENVDALFHAAVDEVPTVIDFQQGAGAGDLVGGADKLNYHKIASFSNLTIP